MNERRTQRAETRQEAIELFLESVRRKARLHAISLTDDTGLMISGAGEGDLERIGALGAASTGPTVRDTGAQLHTRDVVVPFAKLRLTTVGAPMRAGDVDAGIQRILGW